MPKSFYFTNNTFLALGAAVAFFSFGLLWPAFFFAGFVVLFVLGVAVLVETLLLFRRKNPVLFSRRLPKRLSNGDVNPIGLVFENRLKSPLLVELVENLPYQFQLFDFKKDYILPARDAVQTHYELIPKVRGKYMWGSATLMLRLGKWATVARRVDFGQKQEVVCYPSFLYFNEVHISAQVANEERNVLQVRKLGQSLEFEQIKDYAQGDDYRHINWKASAKRGNLMVNQYQDERSQDIYCAIDLGRTMLMPFHGQTLLDYAINASLGLSRTVITLRDRIGLIGFSYNKADYLAPRKDWRHFGKINEFLYDINTDFLESGFEYLYKFMRINAKRRSLIVLFTNFDSENALKRNFAYIKDLARHHLVLVVFFENSELAEQVGEEAGSVKEVYTKTVGYDRLRKGRLMALELQNAGIKTVYTRPENLKMEVVKKYVEIKKQQIL